MLTLLLDGMLDFLSEIHSFSDKSLPARSLHSLGNSCYQAWIIWWWWFSRGYLACMRYFTSILACIVLITRTKCFRACMPGRLASLDFSNFSRSIISQLHGLSLVWCAATFYIRTIYKSFLYPLLHRSQPRDISRSDGCRPWCRSWNVRPIFQYFVWDLPRTHKYDVL